MSNGFRVAARNLGYTTIDINGPRRSSVPGIVGDHLYYGPKHLRHDLVPAPRERMQESVSVGNNIDRYMRELHRDSDTYASLGDISQVWFDFTPFLNAFS